MTISLRLTEKEGDLLKRYAELNGISVSELIRQTVMARIEDQLDLQAYEKAYAEFQEDPETFTLAEVEKELGLS